MNGAGAMNEATDAPRQGRLRAIVMLLVGIPVTMACALGIFLLISALAVRAPVLLGHHNVFFCTPTEYATIILVLAGFAISIPIAGMIANSLMWMVPPIRSVLENAKSRVGGSFIRAQSGIATFALRVYLVVVPVYLFALSSNVCLSDSTIYYRPNILFPLRTYAPSQVVELRPRCTRGRGWDIGLDITMTDGSSFDLAVIEPVYLASSERILALLPNVPLNTSQIRRDCPFDLKKLITP